MTWGLPSGVKRGAGSCTSLVMSLTSYGNGICLLYDPSDFSTTASTLVRLRGVSDFPMFVKAEPRETHVAEMSVPYIALASSISQVLRPYPTFHSWGVGVRKGSL